MTGRHSILVVDDEAEVIRSLKSLLRLDYDITGASSAAEAMQILARQPIHIVMTDQRMPEMTGAELLRTIHQQYPDIIRLLFTGYADIKAVIDAVNRGHVYRYINKPWNPDELLAILRDACNLYDLVIERKHLVEQLQRKNAELKQASELKSAFIKVASHEFRTPVTILGGLCKLALLSQSDHNELLDHLTQIDGAVDRLQGLVNQTISMLTSERFDAVCRRQPEDLAALLRLAADDIRPFIGLRRQQFHLNIADNLGPISIDAGKIRDSLNHLLLNAVKFTPDGGSITLSARRRDDGVTIDVTDTGSGIDPEWMPRMFEPFFTGFDVSKHSSGQYEHGARGLGLGLSVVRAFVEMHGGAVTVDSQVGRGSTFTIQLPDAGAPAMPAAGLVAETPPAR